MNEHEMVGWVEDQIKTARSVAQAAQKMIMELCSKRDALLVEINKDNMTSMEWLLKNPNMPGSHASLASEIKRLYGGPWNGINPAGYVRLGSDGAQQKNIELTLHLPNHAMYEISVAKRKSNIRHFMENYLQHLKPTCVLSPGEVDAVGFDFHHSDGGVDGLAYEQSTGNWYIYRDGAIVQTFLGTDGTVDGRFRALDQALDAAILVANKGEYE